MSEKKLEADEDFFPKPTRAKPAERLLAPQVDEDDEEEPESIVADEVLIPRAMPQPDKEMRQQMRKQPLVKRAWERIVKTYTDRPYEGAPEAHLLNALTDARKAAEQWVNDEGLTVDNMTINDFQHRLFPRPSSDDNADVQEVAYVESAPSAPPLAAPSPAPTTSGDDRKAQPEPSGALDSDVVYLAIEPLDQAEGFNAQLAWRSAKSKNGERARSVIHERVVRLDPNSADLIDRLREARSLIDGRQCWAWHAPAIFMAFSKVLVAPEAAEFEPLHLWLKLQSMRTNASVIYRVYDQALLDQMGVETFGRRFKILDDRRLYKASKAVRLMRIRSQMALELADRERGQQPAPLDIQPGDAAG